MKKLSNRPYHITTAIFLIIMITGKLYFQWRADNFILFLLIYFIIIIGIRLDEIKLRLESMNDALSGLADTIETIGVKLRPITDENETQAIRKEKQSEEN